jgi:hypothetical protein
MFPESDVCTGTATIVSQANVSSIASCSQLDTILLPSDASGPISIDGPYAVDSIDCANNSITSLSSTTLFGVNTNITIKDNLALHTLNFSQLTNAPIFALVNLPNLNLLLLQSSFVAGTVSVINTAIKSFPEFDNQNLAQNINFTDNSALSTFTFQGTAVDSLTIQSNNIANSIGINVSCPHLLTAQSLYFSECSDIYLPDLTTVNGIVSIVSSWFTSFSAPKLANVASALKLTANLNMSVLELPKLEAFGVYLVGNLVLSSVNLQSLQNATLVIDGQFEK